MAMLTLLALAAQLSVAQLGDAGDSTDAGDVPDAGLALPPADGGTVGEGGADRTTQESGDSTGRAATQCRDTTECEPGFTCQGGQCTWTGVRSARGSGCLGASASLVWVPLLGLALATRRRP